MLINRVFTVASIVNVSDHTKCIFLDDQQGMARPTLINLHLNEHIQRTHYYLFVVDLDRCM